MTNLYLALKAQLDKLFARKLVIAFIIGVAAAFSSDVEQNVQSGVPLTTNLVGTLLVGAVFGVISRALLAFSPWNIVPSDASTSVARKKKR